MNTTATTTTTTTKTTSSSPSTTTIDMLPSDIKILIMKNLSAYDINVLAGAMSEVFLEITVEYFAEAIDIRQIIVSYIRSRDNKLELTNKNSRLLQILPNCKYLKHLFTRKNYTLEMFAMPTKINTMQLCSFERDLLEILHVKQSLDDIWTLIEDLKMLVDTECFMSNKILFNFTISSILIDLDVHIDHLISDACFMAERRLLPSTPITYKIVEMLNDVMTNDTISLDVMLDVYDGPSKCILKQFCDSVDELMLNTMSECPMTRNILTILVFMMMFGWQNTSLIANDQSYSNYHIINGFIYSLLLRIYHIHDLKRLYMTSIYTYINNNCNFEDGYVSNKTALAYMK